MKKKRILRVIGAALIVLLVWMFWANKALEVNNYIISSKRIPEAFDGFRIVHLSDLHNEEFGEENKVLLAILRGYGPDMIAITGDLVDSSRTDIDVAIAFAKKAAEIAPTYYVTGNHEYLMDGYEQLEAALQNAGVEILQDEAVILEQDGQSIRIAGFDDPCFGGTDYQARLDGLKDTEERYTLWLSHRPELFDVYARNQLDLVLSGHAHGGQFRLPFVGGLAAPGQGFFPQYDSGLYTEGETNMIVSRGIGNSLIPMRFNNRPEVITVSLRKEWE